MSTITVNIDKATKTKAKRAVIKDGLTLTFVVNEALKAYVNGKMKFGMKIETDDEEIERLSKELDNLIEEKIDIDSLPSLEEQLANV